MILPLIMTVDQLNKILEHNGICDHCHSASSGQILKSENQSDNGTTTNCFWVLHLIHQSFIIHNCIANLIHCEML